MQKINQEKSVLAKSVEDFDGLAARSGDASALL